MKKHFDMLFDRFIYSFLFIVIQVAVVTVTLVFFQREIFFFYALCIIISIITGLHIINSDINPAYKIAWLIPIMLVPIFGGLMYVIFGKYRMSKRKQRRMSEIISGYKDAMAAEDDSQKEISLVNTDAGMQSKYISLAGGTPPFKNTATQYFALGEEYFEALVDKLERASRFIFLEYFIIESGKMWDTVLNILKRKAQEGLDVRLMYDDLGCVFTLPMNYDKKLEKLGIKVCVFHRFNSILNSRFNTRDHRKICVIDGNVGFTGGINLADEYINEVVKHGHWKDSGIMLSGRGVWSLTVMFLALWDYYRGEHDYFLDFAPLPQLAERIEEDGYVQPYTDIPVDDELVGETVYMNMINRAHDYVYITTPYLIIDNEMLTAMRTAAKSGIDIRIITPGIPDKKIVYAMTRSHYELLIKAGVRIYEYTPGFIHAKNFVSDDSYAVVGTINLDYRSLYLHYECAVWMYKSNAVMQVKKDFLSTLDRCKEITLEQTQKKNIFQRLGLAILRAFSPLM